MLKASWRAALAPERRQTLYVLDCGGRAQRRHRFSYASGSNPLAMSCLTKPLMSECLFPVAGAVLTVILDSSSNRRK